MRVDERFCLLGWQCVDSLQGVGGLVVNPQQTNSLVVLKVAYFFKSKLSTIGGRGCWRQRAGRR
jgi:hypothetical protein